MKKKLILTITAYLVTLLISGTVQASNIQETLTKREAYKTRTFSMQNLESSSEMLSLEVSEDSIEVATWDISATNSDSVEATLYSNGTLDITGTGKMMNWDTYSKIVPWNQNKNSIKVVSIKEGITNIGNYAFYYCSELTNIEIPESVKSIGLDAFSYCRGLTSIEIPKNITNINEHGLFRGCSALESINVDENNQNYKSENGVLFSKDGKTIICYPATKEGTSYDIPDEVKSVSMYAFCGCKNLISITIPEGPQYISTGVFNACTNLKEITIPEGIIGVANAFYGCSSLTKINLPSTLTTMYNNPLEDCTSLESINVHIDNKTYSSENGVLFSKDGTRIFKYPPKKQDIKIYTIPSNVTYISADAFENCSELEGIDVDENNPNYKSEKGVLFSKDGTTIIKYPEGKKDKNSYEIANTVTEIKANAFYGCSALEYVTVPTSVTSIGDNAFSKCANPTNITIPYNLIKKSIFSDGESLINLTIIADETQTEINGWAFSDWSKLRRVTISEGITNIGNGVFQYCSNLNEINIPDSVTSIGNYAFKECSNLADINIPESVTNIGNYAFSNCTALKTIEIPATITNIENGTFSGCRNVTKIEIPNSVTTIGESAFSGCSSVTMIDIPDSVTDIGKYAFSGCSSVTNIDIPNSVTNIGEGVFKDCSSLSEIKVAEGNECYVVKEGVLFNNDETEIICYPSGKANTNYTIPNSVASIGDYAFSVCSNLEKVNIPDSVTNIGNYAFHDCSGLINIEIPISIREIGSDAFKNCSKLIDVTTPSRFASRFKYAENIIIQHRNNRNM